MNQETNPIMSRFNRHIACVILLALPAAVTSAQERYVLVDRELQAAVNKISYMALQLDFTPLIRQSGEIAQEISKEFAQMDWQQFPENPEPGTPLTFQKEKVVEKVYPIHANQRLQIDNRYGKITVRNWDRNEVKITIRIRTAESSEKRAQNALDRVHIAESKTGSDISFQTTISSGDSNWWSSLTNDGSDRSLSIDYDVYLPKRNALSLTNRYGAIALDDRNGKVEISVSYGSLHAGHLNSRQNSLAIAYSKASVVYLNEGDIAVRYGGLTLSETEKLSLSLSYASGTEIGKVNREVDVSLRYSGGFHMGLGPTIKKANVAASYSSVSIRPDANAAFHFDVAVNYGGFEYNRDFTNIGNKSEGNTSKSYTGYWNKNTASTLNISSKYGSVTLK